MTAGGSRPRRPGHRHRPQSAAGRAKLRGWRREIQLIGSGHGDFGDAAAFIQQLAPGSSDPSGYDGPITDRYDE